MLQGYGEWGNILLSCVTEVCEDPVYVVLSCAAEVWEDGVCVVLSGLEEHGVIALP